MATLTTLALVWIGPALLTFGFITWCLSGARPDRGDWMVAVLASVFWPYSVLSFGWFLLRGRGR